MNHSASPHLLPSAPVTTPVPITTTVTVTKDVSTLVSSKHYEAIAEEEDDDEIHDDDDDDDDDNEDDAQWARSTKNPDVSTGPLARPFARSLAPLTRSLAPHYSLRSRAPLRSLRSLPCSWDSD